MRQPPLEDADRRPSESGDNGRSVTWPFITPDRRLVVALPGSLLRALTKNSPMTHWNCPSVEQCRQRARLHQIGRRDVHRELPEHNFEPAPRLDAIAHGDEPGPRDGRAHF